MQSDKQSPEYYRVRAAQAREMAKAAQGEEAGRIHQEMAQRYDELARQAEKRTGDVPA
jgi:hypothetical protein